jgi:hypothetical protein
VNFREHAQLCDSLWKTVNDPSNNFMDRIRDVQDTLRKLEKVVIAQTKANISREDQINGKLIQRSTHDAIIINEAFSKFFTLVNDICRKAEPQYQLSHLLVLKQKENCHIRKTNTGCGAKQIDDTGKCAKHIYQRIYIALQSMSTSHVRNKMRNGKGTHCI